MTNNAIKEKIITVVKKIPKTVKPVVIKKEIKSENKPISKNLIFAGKFNQIKKSPRELAIAFQVDLKEKVKNLSKYLVSR